MKVTMLSPYLEALLRMPPSLRSTTQNSTHNPQSMPGVDKHPLGAATLRFLFLFEELYGQYLLPPPPPPPPSMGTGGGMTKGKGLGACEGDSKAAESVSGAGSSEPYIQRQQDDVLSNLQIDIEAYFFFLNKCIRKMWSKLAARYVAWMLITNQEGDIDEFALFVVYLFIFREASMEVISEIVERIIHRLLSSAVNQV